jgi:hypothetical protein
LDLELLSVEVVPKPNAVRLLAPGLGLALGQCWAQSLAQSLARSQVHLLVLSPELAAMQMDATLSVRLDSSTTSANMALPVASTIFWFLVGKEMTHLSHLTHQGLAMCQDSAMHQDPVAPH